MADCLFCGIIEGKIQSHKVLETPDAIAFLDINPRNPGHTLVVPRKHYTTLLDMPESEVGKIGEVVKRVAVMVKNGVQAHGISVVQNNGKAAGQVVDHVHFHVIPRFLNEGPVAFEALMPAKKIDENSMKNIKEKIAASKTAKSVKTEKPKQEKSVKSAKEDEEDIDFNF